MKQKILLFVCLFMVSFALMAADTGNPSLNDLSNDLGISVKVYPNPSTGKFFLTVEAEEEQTYQIKLVSLVGQTVESRAVKANEAAAFDLSNHPRGFYFIRVKVGQKELIRRIVIR